MRHREPAICLRTTDYSETSQVVAFFTRGQGVVRLLGKGTKRPKSKSGGAIDLLAEGDLVFSGASRETLGTLIEFTETVVHTGLRKDASRLDAAVYMIELAGEMLAAGDPHVEAFDLLHGALGRLGQEGSPVAAVLAYFQWRLLGHVGLMGELDRCVACGEPVGLTRGQPAQAANGQPAQVAQGQPAPAEDEGVYFSSSQGGLLCRNCEGAVGEKYRLDAAAREGLAVLKAVSAGRKLSLPEDQARAANRVLAYHAAYQLGKPLRMARHAI